MAKKHRKVDNDGYGFIINKPELLKIYDSLVNIKELIGKDTNGFFDCENNELHKAIWKLDEWYAYLLADCGLVEIIED